MHRSNLVAIFLLLAMACLAACQSTDTVPPIASAVDKRVPPNPDFLPGSDSYTYKSVDGIELRLHVFNNSDGVAKPKPAIVFFFGGGLRKGSVTQFEFQAKALSKLGMLAVVADYRVKLRHNTGHTEAIADAQAVIRWLRDHAALGGARRPALSRRDALAARAWVAAAAVVVGGAARPLG